MRFRSGFWLGLLASVLLTGQLSRGQEVAHIRVRVNDSADVEPAVLKLAEIEARRLFAAVGIVIEWVNCANTDECRHFLRSNEFALHIVRAGATRNDSVFGEAFLGEDGRGKYSDVFFNRIQAVEDTDTGMLLGAIVAHELGHLLLGSHAHSSVGIMEPVWKRDNMRRVRTGLLSFTREQGELMRNRIGKEEVAVRVRSVVNRSRIEY